MDFKNAKELLDLCNTHNLSISEVMIEREIQLGETTAEIICLSGGIFCYSYNRKCYGNKMLQKVNRIRNEGSGIL